MNEPVEIEKRRPFRPVDIQAVYFEQGGACALCPADIGGGFIADHRVPRALGGRTNRHNLQLLCLACNERKTGGRGGDISQIARAVRIARKSDPATRPQPKRPLRSKGFDRSVRRSLGGVVTRER